MRLRKKSANELRGLTSPRLPVSRDRRTGTVPPPTRFLDGSELFRLNVVFSRPFSRFYLREKVDGAVLAMAA
jgi:hypothetical protein